ncbi:MAG: DUF4397 domain-containing protein [Gemmatimonadaceae bacterium]
MTSTIRLTSMLVTAAVLAACGRDAQTDEAVTTRTADGEASTSISGDLADKRGEALVRVVNAVSGAKGLSVRADETHALPTVDYKAVSPYQPIDKTWVSFQVSGESNGAYMPLETNREMLVDGHRYTMVVMREADGDAYRTRIVRDNISDDMSKAHLRVIHAASGVDEVDVVARGGDKLFEGVNFSSEAGFKDLDPWKGTLEIRTEDGNKLLLTVPNVNLQAGRSYSIVLTRGAQGKLEAVRFEDMPVAQ